MSPRSRHSHGLPLHPFAIGSIVFAILGYIILITLPVAILLGHIARHQIRKNRSYDGSGMALTGLIIAYPLLGLFTFIIISSKQIEIQAWSHKDNYIRSYRRASPARQPNADPLRRFSTPDSGCENPVTRHFPHPLSPHSDRQFREDLPRCLGCPKPCADSARFWSNASLHLGRRPRMPCFVLYLLTGPQPFSGAGHSRTCPNGHRRTSSKLPQTLFARTN